MVLDIKDIIREENDRYEKFIKSKPSSYDTRYIVKTVNETYDILNSGVRSTLIYGQPQSGKTDMMTALCCKLFDNGTSVIIMLVQDNVELNFQNMRRFVQAGIEPAPVWFKDVIEPDYNLNKSKHLVFCRKNSKQLEELLPHTNNIKNMVVIDDETDYATPNSKVNKQEKTRINERVSDLVNKNNIFIGVTATPARNLANNTLNTDANNWIYFEPHDNYYGYEFFFPDPLKTKAFKYRLDTLSEENSGESKEIREAFFNFCVNVAFLNLTRKENSYIMLVHSSLKIADHDKEKKIFIKIKSVLLDQEDSKFEPYYNEIYDMAKKLCQRFISTNLSITAQDIVKYINKNISRSSIAVLDVEGKKNVQNISMYTTNPEFPFTVVIGGNTISRGLTFTNMLSMYFTRDVKGRMGQGTYIQRARMFGARDSKLMPFFTLTMPLKLYQRWWACFSMYDIMLQNLRAGFPLYAQTTDNQAVPSSSIDKETVDIDNGQLGFKKIRYNDEIDSLIKDYQNNEIDSLAFLNKASGLDRPLLPRFFIDGLLKKDAQSDSFIIHAPDESYIENFKEGNYDAEEIKRTKGGLFSGGMKKKYESHDYVFWPLRNKKGQVRLWFINIKEERKDRIKYFKNLRTDSKVVSYQ